MFKQALSASSRALSSRAITTSATSRSFVARPLRTSSLPSATLALRTPAAARWYSDKTEATDAAEAKTEAEPADKAAEAPSSEAELKTKLEAKEKEALQWKDQYMRSVADFRNLQERTKREQKAAKDFAIQKFAKDLVDSVDNLDRALSMGQEKLATEEGKTNTELQNFYEGVKMTEGNMMSILTKHGLERFDPTGEKFNPNEHEATFMTPMPDKEDNTVFFVQQKGFKLNGRILRAAKVGVVKSA